MYKEQYYLTIAVVVITGLAWFISTELFLMLTIPIPIIWIVGMLFIKLYKDTLPLLKYEWY